MMIFFYFNKDSSKFVKLLCTFYLPYLNPLKTILKIQTDFHTTVLLLDTTLQFPPPSAVQDNVIENMSSLHSKETN